MSVVIIIELCNFITGLQSVYVDVDFVNVGKYIDHFSFENGWLT